MEPCSRLFRNCYTFYISYLCDPIKDVAMDGACGTHGENINASRFVVGKPKEKTPLGKHRRISGGSTKMDINPLKPKRRPLYLKTQSVPRCKHFSSRL